MELFWVTEWSVAIVAHAWSILLLMVITEREKRSNKREIEQATQGTLVPYTAAVSLPPTAIFTYRLA
jgi:hypothetical protein